MDGLPAANLKIRFL